MDMREHLRLLGKDRLKKHGEESFCCELLELGKGNRIVDIGLEEDGCVDYKIGIRPYVFETDDGKTQVVCFLEQISTGTTVTIKNLANQKKIIINDKSPKIHPYEIESYRAPDGKYHPELRFYIPLPLNSVIICSKKDSKFGIRLRGTWVERFFSTISNPPNIPSAV